MTNEEKAIDTLFYFKMHFAKSDICREHFDMAIKVLEQQPCEDAVSRDEVLKAMAEAYDLNDDYDYRLDVERKLKQLPSVIPQPKRGKWIVIRKEYEFMGGIVNEPQGCKCSNCGGIVKFKSGFCPSCGSYNGGEKDGNE